MMNKKIIIDANFPNETRVALLNNDNIEDIIYETATKQLKKGNIYLAKITRIEPSLQAAFIDYGNDKSGFLPFLEIHPDYYHIPVSDQKASINSLKEITPPRITSEDLADSHKKVDYSSLINEEEIDLTTLEKLVDEKIQPEFDLEASENDFEPYNKNDSSNQQKQYKIQEVIKKGQILLVQVTKEERGNKGASFTTYISIAGKYCVLMPNKPSQNGVSRKISNAEERKRLKNIISELTIENDRGTASVIARTAAIGHTTLDLKRDYDYLVRLWNKIRETTLTSKAPCFIHEEEGIIQKTIRDMFDHTIKELSIQGEEAYLSAIKFMRDILPTEVNKIKHYKNKSPIFTDYKLENQLACLYQPIVALPSGGYIVINPTEALISIDVNSGKATSERNIEETALKTNLEATREIARQAKLRDLSGLLIIDFIDMAENRNRKIIERSLKEFFRKDRAKIQIGNISNFGLLEMSRQRLRPSFLESNSSICTHCNGKGVVRAEESNAMLILRTVENEVFNDRVDIVNVYANISSVIYLLNNKRKEVNFIEQKYNLKLNFNCDPTATSDSYSVEKIKLQKNNLITTTQEKPALQNISSTYQSEISATKKTIRHNWKNPSNSPKEEIIVEDKIKTENNEIIKPKKEVKSEEENKTLLIESNDDVFNDPSNEESTQSLVNKKKRKRTNKKQFNKAKRSRSKNKNSVNISENEDAK